MELALGCLAHLHPVVLLAVSDNGLEVVPRREVLTGAGQDHHPDVIIGIGQVERGVQLVNERAVLRVGHVGTVHRHGGHRPVDFVQDCLECGGHVVHPLACGHGVVGPSQSRGNPRTRSPTRVRWISLVPAKMEDAW